MVHPFAMLFIAAGLAILVFSPGTTEGTQDLADTLGRLQDVVRPRHCGHRRQIGQDHNGVFTIYHKAAGELGQRVWCIMGIDNDDWTVILWRNQNENSPFYFYRNWTDYASGFGTPRREYWIGNRAIHALTSDQQQMKLQVILHNHDNKLWKINYGRFTISSEEDNFRISVGDYTGPEGWDVLTEANGQPFQTFDRIASDNSAHVNCAAERRGAWWYTSNCEGPNLNGVNFNGEHLYPGTGIQWLNRSLEGVDWSKYSFAHVRMMIKPAGSGRRPRR
ncbi:ryncolin-4-like [Haemaphysalis longicornis]